MVNIDKFIDCIIQYGKIKNFIISEKVDNIDNLRKFHNFIKSQLIINNCQKVNCKNLLDIACGRGGDLHKWLNHKLNIKYILAFDSHAESIYSSIKKGDTFDGAIARFQNAKKNYGNNIKSLPFINFQHLNLLNPNILYKLNTIDKDKLYDVISCQFALHYFSENTDTLNKTMELVSKKLRKGGIFIGTATDGDRIYNILQYGNVNIPLLTLIQGVYGSNNYLFYINIKSTIVNRQNYFELQGASSEYYLFKQKLIEIANKYNLELVEYKSFYEWYQIYKKDKSFKPLTLYETIISFLNFSFIFKKK